MEITINANNILVKGPQGVLSRDLSKLITLTLNDNNISVKPTSNVKASETTKIERAMWGLTRQLVKNMVEGVSKGFSKSLVITGNGYKASMIGSNKLLQMSLGYSHDIIMAIPGDIDVKCNKNIITISGCDKEKVGLIASRIRANRPTEPYKGKGLEYEGVIIIKKASKKK